MKRVKLKVKTPASYFLWIIFFCIIVLFFAFFFYPDITDVFFYLRAAIVGWIVLILLALIGAIFVGMFLSHRILSIGGFTPFEKEILKMREDIDSINKKLDKLIEHENIGEEKKEHEAGEDIRKD